jgi:bacillithiol biosynthesis cysteine-adding enzyme BshC
MTLRFVPTPIPASVELPTQRESVWDSVLAEAILPSAARSTALQRLSEPGSFVVTTGQQPGLFTGPLYTIYKAVSAASLARVLERLWQRPVVPVFWSAGDDHDYAEASQANWISNDGSVAGAALPPRAADAPLTPMYRQVLGAEVVQVLQRLADDLPSAEFKDSTLEWLHRHYRPEATVAGSFAGALAELLAPLGMVVLDSTHPTLKRLASRHLVRALGLTRDLDRDLEQRAEELRLAGVDPGVAVGDGASLVMLEGSLGRDRLVMENGEFVARRGRERFDLAALQRIAASEPQRLSPNVLLRPVVESALLPTVAYLAGPGELRYLALARPVYERLRISRQLALPRWSGILVEPRVDRVLQKFSVDLEELLEPAGPLEARLVRAQLPDEAVRSLALIRSALESGYDRLGAAATDIDPTLARPVQNARNQALTGVHDIEKKLVQHLKRRQEIELGQISKARALVLPENKPQERVLTIAPFLARHGPSLLIELGEVIEAWYASALEGALHPS